MLYLPIFLSFCTIALIGVAVIPTIFNKTAAYNQKRARQLNTKLDRVLPRQKIKQMTQLYLFAPVIMATILYFFLPPEMRVFGVVLGIIGGFVFPGIYIKTLIAKNRKKFEDQLIDSLMIMSSSFRGGLSLIQAMESVVDEMGDPINQEFLTVLGENKMGVSLEEALNHLYYRMPSSSLQQMITAILLARETGGNLPAIFSRIVSVIREHKRIKSQIDTLCIQGKIQGAVMSMLPVGFCIMIYSTQPTYFDHMLSSQMGKALLVYAAISETIGAFLIFKISTLKDF